LTENHIPPEAVGNDGFWIGRSYLTAVSEGKEMFRGRAFKGGLRFRTLCHDCNTGLGGREDKAIIDFFDRVRKLVESRIITSPIVRVPAKPNLIYKGLLAHLISANDSGVPCSFDSEAREIFFGRRDIRLSSWNLFYWIFTGSSIFLMRNAYHTQWHPTVEVTPIQILKSYPLGFMFAQKPWFMGLPNMMQFRQSHDDDETDLPIILPMREGHQHWPAVPVGNTSVLLAGNTFGLVANKN
jgi:hypothetical protein